MSAYLWDLEPTLWGKRPQGVNVPDTKKNIEAALTELKRQKIRLEENIREFALANEERTRVVTAIRDLEHALKAVRGGSAKPGPKRRKVAKRPTATVKRRKPGPKPKAKKKPGPKPKAKVAKKKTKSTKGWTPAKRAAMRRKMKAYWAQKKKKKESPAAKKKVKSTKSKPAKKTAKGWTPARRKAASLRAKKMWA
jgi:hypothetical protein